MFKKALLFLSAFVLLMPEFTKANVVEDPVVFSPLLMEAIATRIQDMSDPSTLNVAKMIEDEVAPFGLKRIDISEGEWTYGKGVGLKTIDGGFVYDFQSPDAFVLRVSHFESATVELLFKNKEWCQAYKQAFHNLEFIQVPYFTSKRNTYIQPGNNNRVIINDEEDVCTVVYESKYFVEPSDLSAYDIITALGEPANDLISLAENRGYVMADDKVNSKEGAVEHIFMSQGCKLSKNKKGVLKVDNTTGNNYTSYSYVHIAKEDGIVKDIFFRAYQADADVFTETLISRFFFPEEDSFMRPADAHSGYAQSFKDPEGRRADLRTDSNGFVTLQMYP